MHKLRKSHLAIAMRLLRYLKNSPGKGVSVLRNESLSLTGYSDGDLAKCMFTRKSVSGYLVFFGSTLVSWKSKKQSTISRSSTESEYRSLGPLACELIWVLKVLTELKLNNVVSVDVMCDNESAIKLALNPVFHEKSKHFEIDVHFIRGKFSKRIIMLVKVRSEDQIADILTKSLSGFQHNFLCDKMGLCDPFAPNHAT